MPEDAYKYTNIQRYSKLSVNASPEPVAKGKTITVTGKLTRANWETHDYRGYTNQPVKPMVLFGRPQWWCFRGRRSQPWPAATEHAAGISA